MKKLILLLFIVLSINLSAQLSIDGILQDEESSSIMFSNVVLYSLADSSMVKVESSNEEGNFSFKGIAKGNYFIVSSYVGFNDYQSSEIILTDVSVDMGIFQMLRSSVELATAEVKLRNRS